MIMLGISFFNTLNKYSNDINRLKDLIETKSFLHPKTNICIYQKNDKWYCLNQTNHKEIEIPKRIGELLEMDKISLKDQGI